MGSIQVGLVRDLATFPPQDPAARLELYNAALELLYSTESAQNTAQRLYHGHLPLAMAQTGNDLKVFEILASVDGKKWKLDELAKETTAEPALLRRILRCLAGYGMVVHNKDNTYSASNITRNLTVPGAHAGIKHYSLTMTPAYNAIPQFLANTNYRNPSTSAPFNLAYNTPLSVFEWRQHNPENARVGQAFMAAQRMGQRSVWESHHIPLHDFHLSDDDIASERIMFCNVGGGMGHQCLDLRKHQPLLRGKMVTQDLALAQDLIRDREEMTRLGIEIQAHDFTTEQPVKGAKVYYLRNVIHNWNDETSRAILGRIREVMVEDSVVVVDEVVLPEVGATWKMASMDVAMMTMLAARERTEGEFRGLMAEVGLRVRECWRYDEEYGDCLIFAVPV